MRNRKNECCFMEELEMPGIPTPTPTPACIIMYLYKGGIAIDKIYIDQLAIYQNYGIELLIERCKLNRNPTYLVRQNKNENKNNNIDKDRLRKKETYENIKRQRSSFDQKARQGEKKRYR